MLLFLYRQVNLIGIKMSLYLVPSGRHNTIRPSTSLLKVFSSANTVKFQWSSGRSWLLMAKFRRSIRCSCVKAGLFAGIWQCKPDSWSRLRTVNLVKPICKVRWSLEWSNIFFCCWMGTRETIKIIKLNPIQNSNLNSDQKFPMWNGEKNYPIGNQIKKKTFKTNGRLEIRFKVQSKISRF